MKLGPHAIRTTPQALALARVSPIVKGVDNVDVLKAAPDGAIRVFRHYFRDQSDFYVPTVVAAILDALGGYRHPNLYVEVWNEIPGQFSKEHGFQLQQIVPILHHAGVKVCGPCWATGDYEAAVWEFYRLFDWFDLDAVGLHAYWGNQGHTIWHALRYRQFWQTGDPPILLTEVGRDRVEGGQGGWQRDGITAEQYVAELVAYDRELARDDYVLGATVFTSGPTGDWNAFSIDDIGTQLIAALAAKEQPMATLEEQYRDVFEAWRAAGGVTNNFRQHLLGIGAIEPKKDDLTFLLNQLQATLNQIRTVAGKLPLA